MKQNISRTRSMDYNPQITQISTDYTDRNGGFIGDACRDVARWEWKAPAFHKYVSSTQIRRMGNEIICPAIVETYGSAFQRHKTHMWKAGAFHSHRFYPQITQIGTDYTDRIGGFIGVACRDVARWEWKAPAFHKYVSSTQIRRMGDEIICPAIQNPLEGGSGGLQYYLWKAGAFHSQERHIVGRTQRYVSTVADTSQHGRRNHSPAIQNPLEGGRGGFTAPQSQNPLEGGRGVLGGFLGVLFIALRQRTTYFDFNTHCYRPGNYKYSLSMRNAQKFLSIKY